jgi:cobalamin synthase
VVMALVFVLLTGVSVMLGCTLQTFHWALVAVPAVALIATVACFLYARAPTPGTRFEGLKAQIEADVQAMGIAGERK